MWRQINGVARARAVEGRMRLSVRGRRRPHEARRGLRCHGGVLMRRGRRIGGGARKKRERAAVFNEEEEEGIDLR